MIIRAMTSIGVQGNHPRGSVAPCRLFAVLALVITASLTAGGCGFKTPPRSPVEALPPTGDFQVRQRGDALLVSWSIEEPAAVERFGGVRGYRFLLQRHPVFCGVCPPDSTRTVKIRADGGALRRENGRIAYRLSGEHGAVDSKSAGPALLRVRMVTLYGSGENRPTAPALLEPPAPMAAPRLMWRWMGPNRRPAGQSTFREAQLYWKAKREGVLRVIGAGGRHPQRYREQETFLRANLYRRVAPAPWPLTPLNPNPLDTGRWSVTQNALRSAKRVSKGGVEYVLRWIDRFGNEGPPSNPVRIGQGKESR